MTKLYTQDNYSTELTNEIVPSSGSIELVLRNAPSYTRGYVFIGNPSNPETAYFHDRVGTTIYIAGPNRKNAYAHKRGDTVSISNSAAMINRLEDNSITTHTPEINGLLSVGIFGGDYIVDGKKFTDEYQTFTVSDNTTTYIYFRHLDKTVQKGYNLAEIEDTSHTNYGQLICTVVAAEGKIISVTNGQPKNYANYNSINNGGVNTETPNLPLSYIDTLDADTVDAGSMIAIHNPGDVVDKKTTTQEFFEYAQSQGFIELGFVGYAHTQSVAASTWTITHNLNSVNTIIQCYNDSGERIIPDTITRNTNSVVVTFAGTSIAGLAVVGTPSGSASSNVLPLLNIIAGEDLAKGDFVRMGISGRTAGLSSDFTNTTGFETCTSTKSLMQTIGVSRNNAIGASLYLKKTSAPDTTSALVELFATTTGTVEGVSTLVPTGSALASCTIPNGSLSTTPAWVYAAFSAPYATDPALRYVLKITGVGAQELLISYGDDTINDTKGLVLTGGTTTFANKDFGYKLHYSAVSLEDTSKVYLTSALKRELTEVTGVVQSTISAGGMANVEPQITTSLTGLSALPYYLNNEAGKIVTDSTYPFFKIRALSPISATSGILVRFQELANTIVGPASAVDNKVAFFDGTTGKILKDNGISLSGSNTGDETTATIKSKLGITTLSGSNTGDQDLSGKQDTLVSGTNIKTIAGQSILGSGNISVPGTGTVVGPVSSGDGKVALFDGTSGNILKDSGLTLSGTNTGDEDAASIKSKLGITTLSGSNTGDQDLSSYATKSGTETLTNKRITKRVGTTTSSATPTINTDNVDMYIITAQAEAITSFTTNLSGTPTNGQGLWISITGTAARAITWGASFEASTVALPTTTVTTARLDVGFIWNAATSKWRCIASS